MSVLIMLLRKMARNRWPVACWFAGMLICVALTSSMPIYKQAALQRMLVKDLERSYAETGHHPGLISVQISMRTDDPAAQKAILQRLDEYWSERVTGSGRLRLTLEQRTAETVRFRLTPADPTRVDPGVQRSAKLAMRTDLEQHVRLVDGRFPSPEPVDGVYEAMVTDGALAELDMLLGQEYVIDDPFVRQAGIRIRPVAVIEEQNLNDVYWSRQNLQNERYTLFLPHELFLRDFGPHGPVVLAQIGALAAADYTVFDLETAAYVLELKADMPAELMGAYRYSVSESYWFPGSEAMTAYREREQTLRALLWWLNIPLFVLIGFYFWMVTGMLVERQQGEIAVLRSRGASRLHLMLMYAAEFGLLASGAALLGPWLGAAFTRVLGATSTFLSFVDRGAMPVTIDGESWQYAIGTAAVAWALNLVPVFAATRATIVDQKRTRAREDRRPLWQTFGFDVLLLAVAAYGYYAFQRRMRDLIALGLDGLALSADPLLYLVPVLFILGFGLLLMRLYPLAVALAYRIGRGRWAPQHYAALLLVTRRNRMYHGLMIFLVLTIGTGLYNAHTARTINSNMEDQIRYAGGADIVLRQHWPNDAPPPAPTAGVSPGAPQSSVPPAAPARINYLEPPFEPVETLPGVERAAKVFVREDAEMWFGNRTGRVKLMGIETDAFGETAWMKDGLLPHHFYAYLNLLASDARAVLISRTAADHFGVEPGDAIDIGWEGIRPTRLIVYGIVEYFPTFNPNKAAGGADPDGPNPMLVVAHLGTIQSELALEPYDVWLKLAPGADRRALVEAAAERGVRFEKFEDVVGQIAASRTDPFRMAINGVMSLGFIVSLAVSFIGFLLFWLQSLQGRMLQLGIFRAMGLSFRQLLGMLVLEQLLTTGAGCLIGLATGSAAGRIFVPQFQLLFDPGRIVPPFEVTAAGGDAVRLAAATLVMLAAAVAILAGMLKRMNVHQAVKLGEE